MRNLNMNEVAHISGGLDHKDLAGLVGAYLGWQAGVGIPDYPIRGYNVGGLVSGIVGAMAGNVVGRFTAGFMDTYVDPIVDRVTG